MSKLFLTVLGMSFTSCYIILFVILVRLLLKKAPKVISYILWGVVAFRLIIPFSFESMFSLVPQSANTIPIQRETVYQYSLPVNIGTEVADSFANEVLPELNTEASVYPFQNYIKAGTYIWVLGIIVLLIYSLGSVLLIKRNLKSAKLIEQNIYEAENLKTPFVLGMLRPKIYLPVGLNVEERSYILLHEQTHIQRKDHIVKILAFLILSIHWFNPLVWISFMLMSTDMELSCDERVLKEMGEDIKKPYANSLLSLAVGKHIVSSIPLAFGEGNVKGRIKNVLKYKKPRFWIIFVGFMVVITVSICLLSNPKLLSLPDTNEIHKIEIENYSEGSSLGVATITDKGDIDNILSNLSGAKKTMQMSTNDYPAQNNYLVVRLMLENELRTLCLYSDGYGYYIEEPYIGIYRSNRELNDAIHKIYTEKIDMLNAIDNLNGDELLEAKVTEQETVIPNLSSEEKTESTAQNREEIVEFEDFDKMGITIRLPENTNWIGNPVCSIIDGKIAQVRYYDKIVETEVTLRVGKEDIQTLAGINCSFDNEREIIWNDNIKVQFAISDNKMEGVLASWNYKEYNCILWSSISDEKADVTSIAKTAMYISNHMQ
ncbi:M56 family metallopeptidase [Acetivibrio straminisolvens]|uniref:M56 family metallopeptidase n=1 Tax=Acetivibrio straminisolvens TaxID=253314 RepID=UPI0038995143